MPFCTACSIQVDKKKWVGHVRSTIHKNSSSTTECDGVVRIASAFRGRISSYRIFDSDLEHSLPETFIKQISHKVGKLLRDSLEKYVNIKVNFEFFGNFVLFKNEGQEVKSFGTKNVTLHRNFDFDKLITETVDSIKKKIDEFEERDSGWTFLNNLYLEVNINKYEVLRGGAHIDLPKFIKNKKACLNMQNKDNACFLWSIVAALHTPKGRPDRTSSYPHYAKVLNTEGISYPVTTTDINMFESNNPNLSVNIYSLKNNRVVVGPIYKSEYQNRKTRVNLLLLEKENNTHYVLIKNLPRLVRSQITKHHSKLYFCEDCLLFLSSEQALQNHLCSGVATVLPGKGTYLEFKNFARKQDMPFVIYADFETLLAPYQSCQPDPNLSFTEKSKKHIPIAFAYHVVCSFDTSLNRFVQYRGSDCVKKFIQLLLREVKRIYSFLNKNIPMIFTSENAKQHKESEYCHICKRLLFTEKVRDHDHLTGLYRGAAHAYCNLKFRVPKVVPIFFHNLAGYDCHLFIKELSELCGPIKIIPKNKENYISFTKFIQISDDEFAQVRFVDSYKFLGAGLQKLASGLHKTNFTYMSSHFPDQNEFALLTRKGVYPYDYMTNWKLFADKHLPAKSMFYNSMTDDNISDEEYSHAQNVWKTFQIKNMGEYTDLYLKTDVLLLTDVFENFRMTCKTHYSLDPAFYLTSPSLSFDAMLLKTGVRLELVDNLEIIRIIQKGIRGGICMCSKRHAKANNPYMESYDSTKRDSFLVYIDCNNLYGYSMCQSLPVSDFRFLSEIEIEKLNVETVLDDAPFGYILEVDLLYPDELHDSHKDYPFCAEKFVPPGGKTAKLTPNLYHKFNYVIHYVHLKKCMANGLILDKIHRGITFRQQAFLKEYIDLNTELRKKAKTQFQQDLFKLNNNSIFGKTLENNEKHVDIKLVTQWCDTTNKTKKHQTADKLIARPNFHSVSVFTENMVAIQMKPERVILDKPIYIGFAVLELSKSHMYDFHYSVIKPKYGDQVQLCYTDTDSFIYEIHTDFYKDMKKSLSDFFDTSNYEPHNKFGLPLKNKKVPGLFKDELGGEILTDFIGLRSKLYCIKTDHQVIKKAKGVKKCVVRNLDTTDYQEVLMSDKIVRRKQNLFKSIKHEIYTQTINKVALSNTDDKRCILPDKVSTLPWGHYSLF